MVFILLLGRILVPLCEIVRQQGFKLLARLGNQLLHVGDDSAIRVLAELAIIRLASRLLVFTAMGFQNLMKDLSAASNKVDQEKG